MTCLADHISVAGRFARSANLERDAGRAEPLDGYIVTARAIDAVDRIAFTAEGPSGGAWSITGPYGSGKSSLALLLDAAMGPSSTTRETAWKLIDQVSSATGERVRQAHRRHRTIETGFHRALVTANREPLNHTVLRALHLAVVRSYDKIPRSDRFPAAGRLKQALRDMAGSDPRRTGPSPTALVEIARCLAESAPLLLIIDEFGKNLEAVGDSRSADPYLLQQLAEAGQGSGLPIFVLTLQHLSFEDHLISADGPQRREWAKVQGRFEDITYVENAQATRALIRTAFKVGDDNLKDRINHWAKPLAKELRLLLGVADLADSRTVAACYPLHPLVTMVLPELCSRYGQHERTLFSFLAGSESTSVAAFLKTTELLGDGALPTVGLDVVYDYFVDNGGIAPMSTGRSSRWTEITIRLRDTHGLTSRQQRLAKAVALLNLVSTNGPIRASSRLLTSVDPQVDDALTALAAAGVVTYREFADEYRIWDGTDVDISRLLEISRDRVRRQKLVDVLSALDRPAPVVAARHSAQRDVFRVFDRRYVDGSESVEPLDPFSPYDGEVLLVVGSDRSVPSATWPPGTSKPIVAAIPSDISTINRVAREAAAVATALNDPTVTDDRVARAELGERLAEARAALEHAISAAFSVDACRWVMVDAEGEPDLTGGRGSAGVSDAADRAYRSTPLVRNEMLNRGELTSQGAMARRLLLAAMIERGSEKDLGFDGYGPEVAMYRAFLEVTKLHGFDRRTGLMVFRRPKDPSLQGAWDAVATAFKRATSSRVNINDIYATLLSPPFGMKGGVISVFITAALLSFKHEVAIYEHGTFMPLLTPEMSERMVRNPVHFEVKHFANTAGARRQVIAALAKRLGVRPGFRKHRVANVLAIVGHLVSCLRRLEPYTLHTSNLRPETLQARKALVSAIEPDKLLFEDLPAALGLGPVSASAKTYAVAGSYARRVRGVLDDLTGCYGKLLEGLHGLLSEMCGEAEQITITGQARAIKKEVVNPSVRAFVLALADDKADTDWIKAVATVVVGKAPAEWNDDDERLFEHELPHHVEAFQRLVALHADRRVRGGGPFQALRLTVTRPDGTEEFRLVSVDESQRRHVQEALDEMVSTLGATFGSTNATEEALLAVLGDRFFVHVERPTAKETNMLNDGATGTA